MKPVSTRHRVGTPVPHLAAVAAATLQQRIAAHAAQAHEKAVAQVLTPTVFEPVMRIAKRKGRNRRRLQ